MPNAVVGVCIQQLADRCTRLPRLSDEWAKAAGENPFRRSVPPNNIEASPDRAVEGRRVDLATARDLGNHTLPLRLDSTEPRDVPCNTRC